MAAVRRYYLERHGQGPFLRRSPHQFRTVFNNLLAGLQLNTPTQTCGYKPYSIRRGGATSHFIACGSLDRVVVRGRWAQAKTARIYINSGMMTLVNTTHSPEARELMEKAASQLRLPSA